MIGYILYCLCYFHDSKFLAREKWRTRNTSTMGELDLCTREHIGKHGVRGEQGILETLKFVVKAQIKGIISNK